MCADSLGGAGGGALLLDGSLRSGKAGNRDAEGAAADVAQSHPVAELHAVRITAVFAANAQLDVWTGRAALGNGGGDELAHTRLVERGERVLLEDLVLRVGHEEVAHVIAADAQRGLRQVIRPEAEELRRLSDLISGEGAPRHFDHRADHVAELHFLLSHHLLCHTMHDFRLQVQLLLEAHQRNHHLRLHLDLLLGDQSGRLKDGAGLHLGDLRIRNAQAAAAVPQHRVELVQLLHAVRQLLHGDAHLLRQFLLLHFGVRQELVKRRVQQTDRCRQAFQLLKDPREVLALIRQQLGQCRATVLLVVRQDHLAHRIDAVAFKEHVLRAGQADPHRAKGNGLAGLLRRVRVGAHVEA